MKEIIAKSDGTTLTQHSIDVKAAGKYLLQYKKESIAKLFKLKKRQREQLDKYVNIVCLLHDLGKANSEFELFCQNKIERQAIRHEHVSAYIIDQCLRTWLKKQRYDVDIIMPVILGHHLKSPSDTNDKYTKYGEIHNFYREVKVYLNSKDVHFILKNIHKNIPSLSDFILKSNFKVSYIRESEDRNKFILALKMILIWADTLGSAIIEGDLIDKWIDESLSTYISPEEFAQFLSTIRHSKGIKKPNNLQLSVAKLGKLTNRFAIGSNCGSGKTLGELYFAKSKIDSKRISRLVHITPTRQLVNEAYLKYFIHDNDSTIFHAQRLFSLKQLNLQFNEENPDYQQEHDIELSILNSLNKKYYSLTPDQILSFLLYNRKGIMLSLLFLDSVVIFDELHSYSDNMLKFFSYFCKHFDVPIIVLSATITPKLREVLQDCKFTIFPKKISTESFLKKRYDIKYENNMSYPTGLEFIKQHEYVRCLWVVNTVNRARAIGKWLQDDGYNTIVFHSQYTAKDRGEIYEKILNIKEPTIIVSTQVMELGLDIDADLYLGEIAPVPSLIQRLGRVNRAEKTIKIAPCLIYMPPTFSTVPYLPYDESEMELSKKLFSAIKKASYEDLSKANNAVSSGGIFFDNPIVDRDVLVSYSKEDHFREISDPKIECVLDRDYFNVIKRIENEKLFDDFLVSVRLGDSKHITYEYQGRNEFVRLKFSQKRMRIVYKDNYDEFGINNEKTVETF